jgi:aspartate/methionine/tyrosine aminotransferase
MVAAFAERRQMIIKTLNALPGFRCAMPGGAFYAFPNISGTGFDSRTLQSRLLDETGVAIISGTSFGAFGDGYLRFSYAASLAALEEAMDRIDGWLKRQSNARGMRAAGHDALA